MPRAAKQLRRRSAGNRRASDPARTERWIRNASDRLAVEYGCRFDLARGLFAVWWIERHCRLYEGEQAGERLILRGCAECWDPQAPPADVPDWPTDDSIPPELLERAESHLRCVEAGHRIDWQFDCIVRLFGWVRYSEKWGREIRRFRQASIWVAKKNKKSPTLAAIGLYLECGDGEPGQKVFFGAKDGSQARDNVGKHALEMLRQSPELEAECVPNKTLMQITHVPTRSILRPLSSANSRTQESKEGLNGSVLIDETHVVDREFIDRISRAGISRSEPFHIEVSTAGDNPDGYGKERFDHAAAVEKGAVEDVELFVAIYAAPQDLTPEELDKDPLRYGLMANPAMGHTVDPEEFLSDYRRSKVSLEKLSKFLKYRLNIWQKTARKWLRESDWDRCRQTFTAADLEGETCCGGMDLSKTHDMTALVLAFRACETELGNRLGIESPEAVFLLPYFWMPEEEARRREDRVRQSGAGLLTWADRGFLTLTPGGVLDFGFVESRIRKLAKQFQFAALAYDKTYAEELTQRISEGAVDDEKQVTAEGTGIERVQFGQGWGDFADPTEVFERLVISGNLHHNGHPILAWQAGHVAVRTDYNNNKRPVKPKPGDVRKIDGIVASIMAVAMLNQQQGERLDFYEAHELEVG